MKYHLFLTLGCLIVAVSMFVNPVTWACAESAVILATVAAILATRGSRYIAPLSLAFPLIGILLMLSAPAPTHIGHYGSLQVFAGMIVSFIAVLQAISVTKALRRTR